MTDVKDQIAASVRQIDELGREIAEHWSMIQRCVVENDIDRAISLLNAYYRLREKLEQVEAQLRGTLRGQFSDR